MVKAKNAIPKHIQRVANEGEQVIVLALPFAELSPNARCHWAAKARKVKEYRQLAAWVMKLAKLTPVDGRVLIDLEFYLCRVDDGKFFYYPKDEDNARAAMKAAQDALKDAGIVAGDGKKNVGVGATKLYTKAKEHQGYTCVVMTIRKDGQ
jgi:Holliday junction resolvase RusA-like endonuclease